MTNPTKNLSEEKKNQLISAGVVVGVVVVGGFILKRRVNRKALVLAAELSTAAVESWVRDHEAMGLSVILLPAKLTEQMFLEGAPA